MGIKEEKKKLKLHSIIPLRTIITPPAGGRFLPGAGRGQGGDHRVWSLQRDTGVL